MLPAKVIAIPKRGRGRQSKDAIERYEEELEVWQTLQKLLKPVKVLIPYAGSLTSKTPNRPLRMRRDFGRLLAQIETIAVLHQYQRPVSGGDNQSLEIIAGLEDYYIARMLLGNTFSSTT